MTCKIHGKDCHPSGHAPGGVPAKGLHPFRIGKTRRDKKSGAWGRNIKNREQDPGRQAR